MSKVTDISNQNKLIEHQNLDRRNKIDEEFHNRLLANSRIILEIADRVGINLFEDS